MKKMCGLYDKYVSLAENRRECLVICGETCPSNTNSKCEIIPRKPRIVTVAAWARMDEESGCDIIYATNVLPKHFAGAYDTPCTILIQRKYLKGAK